MLPVLIELPQIGLRIPSYRAMAGLMIVLAYWLGPACAARLGGFERSKTRVALLLLGVAALLGARAHYVAASWRGFAADPLSVLFVWRGGRHAAGALIALAAAAPFVCRRLQLPTGAFVDAITPAIAVLLAVQRLGCFLGGCCFGTRSELPWAMTFPKQTFLFLLHVDRGAIPPDAEWTAAVHPLQLYFALAALLTAVVTYRLYPSRRFDGEVALAGIGLFSALSASLEFLREDFPGRVYWGPLPQLAWTSMVVACVVGAALLFTARRRVQSEVA